MLRGRLGFGSPSLLATLAMATILGAQCKRSSGSQSERPITTDVERPRLGDVCQAACSRYDTCKSAADAPASGFVFDCSPACMQAEDPASDETARLLDCARLDDCTAFFGCVHDMAPATPGPAADADDDNDEREDAEPEPVVAVDACSRVCSRAAACPGGPRDVDACVASCQRHQDAEHNTVLACQHHPTCDALLPCLDAPPGAAPPLTPLGIDAVCVSLCDRTLTCGADKSELDAQQLRALSQDTDDVWMECAIQCSQEVRDDNRQAFDDCLALEPCDKFLACADKL